MGRKLLLTTTMVFFFPNSTGQVASAFLITLFFLIITTLYRPFCTEDLNNFQVFSLLVQALTLFSGILLSIEEFADREVKASGVKDHSTQSLRQRDILSFFVFVINCLTVGWPLMHLVWTGAFAQLSERIAGVFRCIIYRPHKEMDTFSDNRFQLEGTIIHTSCSPQVEAASQEIPARLSPLSIAGPLGGADAGRVSLYRLSRASSRSLSLPSCQAFTEDELCAEDDDSSKDRTSMDTEISLHTGQPIRELVFQDTQKRAHHPNQWQTSPSRPAGGYCSSDFVDKSAVRIV